MSELTIHQLNWRKQDIWEGCMLAAIAHAIMVAHFPDLSHEHSWDGINYSTQDSGGLRGTVSFESNVIVAAFRNETLDQRKDIVPAEKYFQGAPTEILDLANKETLQYLLDEVDGEVKPRITAAFWGSSGHIYTVITEQKLIENGVSLLEYQLMQTDHAMEAWQQYYDMSNGQYGLLKSLFLRRVENSNTIIQLTNEEVKCIGSSDEEGIAESKISFGEIGIIYN